MENFTTKLFSEPIVKNQIYSRNSVQMIKENDWKNFLQQVENKVSEKYKEGFYECFCSVQDSFWPKDKLGLPYTPKSLYKKLRKELNLSCQYTDTAIIIKFENYKNHLYTNITLTFMILSFLIFLISVGLIMLFSFSALLNVHFLPTAFKVINFLTDVLYITMILVIITVTLFFILFATRNRS